MDHGQSQADAGRAPAARLRRAIERLEDVREVLRRDARSGILDGQDHRISLPARLDDDRRSRPAVLAGVVQQVVEQLAQERRMGPDPGSVGQQGQVDDLGRGVGRGRPARCSATQRSRSIGSQSGSAASASARPRNSNASTIRPSWTARASAEPRIATILLARALLPQRDLDLADQDRQRRPQLVRGIAAEPPLPLVGDVQPGQQVVERTAQVVELVAGAGLVQAPAGVGGVEPPRRVDHPRQRRERAPREPAAEQRRDQPGPDAQGDEEPAQRGERRLVGSERGADGQDQGGMERTGRCARRSAPGDPPRPASRMHRPPRAGCGAGRSARRALPIDQPGRQIGRAGVGNPRIGQVRVDQVSRAIDATARGRRRPSSAADRAPIPGPGAAPAPAAPTPRRRDGSRPPRPGWPAPRSAARRRRRSR